MEIATIAGWREGGFMVSRKVMKTNAGRIADHRLYRWAAIGRDNFPATATTPQYQI